jgi:hypothetical protein
LPLRPFDPESPLQSLDPALERDALVVVVLVTRDQHDQDKDRHDRALMPGHW